MRNSAPTNQVDQINLDVVDTASFQSFPASDPPAWASGQVHCTSPLVPSGSTITSRHGDDSADIETLQASGESALRGRDR